MLTAEQVLAAQASQFETFVGLTRSSLESVEKLTALNLATAKSALEDAGEAGKSAFAVKDPAALFSAVKPEALQPAAEKFAAYTRAMYDIFAAAGAEFGKVAEAQSADTQAKFLALVDSAVKNAPAGTENFTALAKSAVSAANDAFDNAQKAAKQAVGVAEANFAQLTSSVAKVTPIASKGKRAA
jgi:phasin family protein